MKKNSRMALVALAPAILAGAACTVRDVRPKGPDRRSPPSPLIKSGETAEIVLVPFRLDKEVPEFDLNRDLNDYLQDQLKTKFKRPDHRRKSSLGRRDRRTADRRDAFWKKAALGTAGTIVLTGKAAFSQEARKALLSTEKRKIEGPFEPEKKWAERRTYRLEARPRPPQGRDGRNPVPEHVSGHDQLRKHAAAAGVRLSRPARPDQAAALPRPFRRATESRTDSSC